MSWEPKAGERRTHGMQGNVERLPERSAVVELDPFEGLYEDGRRRPEGDHPARTVVVLLIDRERDVWVCRDELTREILFVTFTPEGDWCYVEIERGTDPEED